MNKIRERAACKAMIRADQTIGLQKNETFLAKKPVGFFGLKIVHVIVLDWVM
jgi:hypothetical protein